MNRRWRQGDTIVQSTRGSKHDEIAFRNLSSGVMHLDHSLIGSAIAGWYAGNTRIRRARAYAAGHDGDGAPRAAEIHVLVEVEPAMDSEEVLPVWLARSREWQDELQTRTRCTVHLHVLGHDESAVTALLGGSAGFSAIGAWLSRGDG